MEQKQCENLLSLALKQYKAQWSNGESVWIWHNSQNINRGAFLKEIYGVVALCITGVGASCPIFRLDPNDWKWKVNSNVEADYQRWIKQAKREQKIRRVR